MNVHLARIASTATTLLLLASAGMAQQMTAPATASVGEKITISYSNANKGGQTVEVVVYDDDSNQVDVLQIQLNESGEGSVNWTIPHTSALGYEFLADDAGTSTLIDP